MKKLLIMLVSVITILSFTSIVMAKPFENFYDYQTEDGTFEYYLEPSEYMQSVFIPMDKDWYRHTIVLIEDNGVSVYHKDSYNAYAEDGLKGGWLFTIGACVNSDFQNLPSFEYIGFDDETAMNYYAELPTDYQGYEKDESIKAEYNKLWSGVRDVIANIRIGTDSEDVVPVETENIVSIGGSDSNDPITEQKKIFESGDYAYTLNNDGKSVTIVDYLVDKDDTEAKIPTEIDGHTVTEIGPQAFTYKKMKNVYIPDTIKVIGDRAFEYSIITDTLVIPERVKLCSRSFSDSRLPSTLILPNNVDIDECAFSYCDTIKEVYIGSDSVIHSRAFGYCDNLEKVVFYSRCSLKTKAFEYCENIQTVIFNGFIDVEEDTFSYCGDIDFIVSKNREKTTDEKFVSKDVITRG